MLLKQKKQSLEAVRLRNKAKDFPIAARSEGEARAKGAYASKRADGSINDHPQERMRASGQREDSN
ncbi:small, acid-soluble spore protein K [Metabacillus sp. 84]|uniref:small, acid-soluble spore protein K n=1 Tax=Metabacillus sp. 84 TaxID=3404705 RepID=UPI003CEC54D2